MKPISNLNQTPEYTLVFLHGWGMNSGVWDDLIACLDDSITCVSIDLPGYGDAVDADIDAADYNLRSVAQWVANKLPQHCILVGWSLGGLVAQYIAAYHSHLITSLICIASTPKFEKTAEWPGIQPQVLSLFHAQLSDDHQKTLSRFLAIQMQGIADISIRKRAIKDLSHRLISRPQPNKQILEKGLDILAHADVRDMLKNIKVPTLRLYGRLDSLVPRAAVLKISELHPQSRTIVYKFASHAPFVTEPTQIAEDIKAFLAEFQLLNK